MVDGHVCCIMPHGNEDESELEPPTPIRSLNPEYGEPQFVRTRLSMYTRL